MNPLALMIPTVISCSFAFMLPVATPPNAIVFAYGGLSIKDMVRKGGGRGRCPGYIVQILCQLQRFQETDMKE